jgi:type IV pilus biogenesis protein PilP
MPINKFGVKSCAFCLVLAVQGVIAAPVSDLPPAPQVNSTPEQAKPNTASQPSTTVFAQKEAVRALNLGQIEAIQAETVLYEFQMARVKALNELNKNGYDGLLDQPFNPAPPAQDSKTTVKGTAQEATPPQVVEISGDGKEYTALLALSNGNQVSVQNGNQIPGTDYVVKRITISEVVVSGPKQSLLSLSFAG